MNWVVAAILAVLIAVAIGMVLLADTASPSEAWSEAGRLAKLTFKQAKRVVVMVVGATVVVVGIIMIVTPGPAVVVIPLGLAILATEFVSARRLLVRYKGYADTFAKRVGRATPWMPRPWMVGVVIVVTVASGGMAMWLTDWPRHWIVSVGTSLLLMEAVTMYLVASGARGPGAAGDPSGEKP